MRPIVVGANIVFAAFLRDGATREIILDHGLDLRSPPWLWEELAARYEWIQERTHLTPTALDELLRQLRDRILDVPAAAIEAYREEALRRTRRSGRKDAPYIAATLAVDGVLWTHDTKLAREADVDTVDTARLLSGA